MNWETIRAVREIVSELAVVITLAFLVYQLKSTREVTMQAPLDRACRITAPLSAGFRDS